MGHTQAFEAFLACLPQARGREPGLPGVLGKSAWERLPQAVRERFGEPPQAADYAGCFEVVQASFAGRALALLSQLLGTPVVPRTGRNVAAVVRVNPRDGGVSWTREYRWPDAQVSWVRSTKTITDQGTLVEYLPAHLCMALDVYEKHGALHFVSRGYYFELPLPWMSPLGQAAKLHLPLPGWLSPGRVHVVHEDQAQGWFRFTMTVTHPLLGQLFYQTGRFHALGEKTCLRPMS